MLSKPRKTYKGEKNDKDRTKAKLIEAVGKVLESKGYTGLTVSNISKTAGVDRKLIYLYFETVDNLIETYIKQKDYWVASLNSTKQIFENSPPKSSKKLIKSILMEQLEVFLQNTEMQKAIIWQISEPSEIMSEVSREREKMSALFFELSDKEFKNENVDLRAIISLLVSGIYYLVLHAKHTDSTFCEIDLKEEGFDRIKEAIKFVIDATYAKK